ncbi:MAG: hypothetical protein FWE46_05620 [Coriobacteriia bacterium]|nr:hypothetical protein [Coriobacteriia bacterium]
MASETLVDNLNWGTLVYTTQNREIAQADRLSHLLGQESYLRLWGFSQADKPQQIETLSLQWE